MNECRRLSAGAVTVAGTRGPYQLHITCDNVKLAERRFLCALIDATDQECGEFAIACADVMKTMRGLYLRLSEICAYHLQQAYDSKPGEPAPVTAEAIPEAGSAADQLAPCLPGWLTTTATGRRQLHRCLFDVVGAQMESIDHNTLLAMMGVAPAAEAEHRQNVAEQAIADFGNWYQNLHANDQDNAGDSAQTQKTDLPAFSATPAHYHGLISRAMN